MLLMVMWVLVQIVFVVMNILTLFNDGGCSFPGGNVGSNDSVNDCGKMV